MKNSNSLGNFRIWCKNWTVSFISFESTNKTAPRSCPFTNAKHPRSFVGISFNALKQLHQLKCDSIVRIADKLSMKVLNPSTFETQNANLAVRVFNDFVSQALGEFGSKHNILRWHDTSVFNKETFHLLGCSERLKLQARMPRSTFWSIPSTFWWKVQYFLTAKFWKCEKISLTFYSEAETWRKGHNVGQILILTELSLYQTFNWAAGVAFDDDFFKAEE